MNINRTIGMLLVVALLSGLMVFAPAPQGTRASPGVLIDHFDENQTITQIGPGTSGNTQDGALMLGYERDVQVTIVTGGVGGNLISDANLSVLGEFSHSQGAGVIGQTLVSYDGEDNDPVAINYTGLQSAGVGVDLTGGGADNAFALSVTVDDFQANFIITVYTDSDSCSNYTLVLPGGISRTSNRPRGFLMPYDQFAAACAGPADFTDVGAVTFLIDAWNENSDITIHYLAATAADFGDLPDTYGTTADFDYSVTPVGAAHIINEGLFLGASIDGEINGQPGANADDDDLNGLDDEDGIEVVGRWQPGVVNGSQIRVTVSGSDACLVGWVDWNNNGSFSNVATERLFAPSPVLVGVNNLTFTTPAGAFPLTDNYVKARFRLYPRDYGALCSSAKQPNLGHEVSGEVEDYLLGFHGPTAVELISLNSQTAPDYRPIALAIALLALAGAGGLTVLRTRRKS